MQGPEDILNFWLDEVGPVHWYEASEDLDAKIRSLFAETWQKAVEGSFAQWLTYPSGALAYIILVDQFPRNMFRGTKKAFASDRIALAAAKQAIHHKFDKRIDEPARQFFYMPLMHSENLCDQDRCVRLLKERLQVDAKDHLLHAKAHREIIRKFGRFPTRNEALSRAHTAVEKAYVDEGGYSRTIEELTAAA